MTQPARLENIRTLDPHSHAALTDLSSWLGPTREIHEPALMTVVGGKSSDVHGKGTSARSRGWRAVRGRPVLRVREEARQEARYR